MLYVLLHTVELTSDNNCQLELIIVERLEIKTQHFYYS